MNLIRPDFNFMMPLCWLLNARLGVLSVLWESRKAELKNMKLNYHILE